MASSKYRNHRFLQDIVVTSRAVHVLTTPANCDHVASSDKGDDVRKAGEMITSNVYFPDSLLRNDH